MLNGIKYNANLSQKARKSAFSEESCDLRLISVLIYLSYALNNPQKKTQFKNLFYIRFIFVLILYL